MGSVRYNYIFIIYFYFLTSLSTTLSNRDWHVRDWFYL